MLIRGTSFHRRSIEARRAIEAAAVQNRYEGGQRGGVRRSYIPAFVQDQRFDADTSTRQELVRKSRYFERNNSLVNKWADLYEQFTVGPTGLQLIPDSKDDEWNERASEVWDEMVEEAELGTQFSLADSQIIGARTEFIDGEYFMLKTRGGTKPRRPRVQLFEGHRVATPGKLWDQEGKNIYDGIQVDPKTGLPQQYWIATSFEDSGSFEPIASSSVIHVFSPSRIGQLRGLPYVYPVINDLHDLDDLQILEMDAAKSHAQIANVVTNEFGESTDEQLRKQRFNITNQPNENSGTTETLEREKYYRTVLGSRTVYVRQGDKVEQPRTERPAIVTQNYWDYLASKACAGVGISKLLVYPWSIQGTVARADFDIANSFFRSRSRLHAWAGIQVYRYFMDWAIYNDLRVVDPPADWRRVTVRPPRAVNVDVGRNSTALLNEVKARLRTRRDAWAELGMDWRAQERQLDTEERYIARRAAEREKFIEQLAKEAGVPADRIRQSIDKELARSAPAPVAITTTAEDPEDEDEPEDPIKKKSDELQTQED